MTQAQAEKLATVDEHPADRAFAELAGEPPLIGSWREDKAAFRAGWDARQAEVDRLWDALDYAVGQSVGAGRCIQGHIMGLGLVAK